MFTFSNFTFIPNCQNLWHLKNQFFLLLHTDCISPELPPSLLPFTHETHIVYLQWNVSQCVKIWIFNTPNTDSFTQTINLCYKYYSNWICDSFSFQYIIWLVTVPMYDCTNSIWCCHMLNLYIRYHKLEFLNELHQGKVWCRCCNALVCQSEVLGWKPTETCIFFL